MAKSDINQGRTNTMAMEQDATKDGNNSGFKLKPSSVSKLLLRSTGLLSHRFQSQYAAGNNEKQQGDQGSGTTTYNVLPEKTEEGIMNTGFDQQSNNSMTKIGQSKVTKSEGPVFSFFLRHENDLVNSKTRSTKTSPRSTLSSSTSESSSCISRYSSSNSGEANFGDSYSETSLFSDTDTGNESKDLTNDKVDGLGVDFSIARSGIAAEVANEALKRFGTHDLFTIVGVGRGSSRADEILEQDSRPIWQQGYDQSNACDRVDARDGDRPHIISTQDESAVQCSIASIAKLAAANGFGRQKREKSIGEEQTEHHRQIYLNVSEEEKDSSSVAHKAYNANGNQGGRKATAFDKDAKIAPLMGVASIPTFICGGKGTEVIVEKSFEDKEYGDAFSGDTRGATANEKAGGKDEQNIFAIGFDISDQLDAIMAVYIGTESFGIEEVEPLPKSTADNDCNAVGATIEVKSARRHHTQDPNTYRCDRSNLDNDDKVLDSADSNTSIAVSNAAQVASSPARIFVAFATAVGRMSSMIIGIRQTKETEEKPHAN